MSTAKQGRFRFTLKQLFIAIGVISLLLGFWAGWMRKVVTVRPARSDDKIRERYFGIDEGKAKVRNIAVVKGTFTRSTWLSASLFAVEGGQNQNLNSFTVGRTSNQIGGMPWETLTITLALGSWDTPQGRIVQLGSIGHSRGGGSGGECPVSISATFSHSFSGSITPGREYIIYAEGDTAIQLDQKMTLSEFCQKNKGRYLVVTAELR